jgi:ankyrin repeat protein
MQLGSIFLISVFSGETPLIYSSCNGRLDVTRFLVESKANVEAKDNRYYTPTTLPFKSSTPLQFSSIFLISVFSGWTALIHSSANGKLDVTRFLVESKANVEAKNN